MDENGDEEDTVEVRDRSGGADDNTPEEAHGPVGNVVLVTKNVRRARYSGLPAQTYRFSRVPPPPAG